MARAGRSALQNMNIKKCKEIKHTLLALQIGRKDAAGLTHFPNSRQRPILLMGPPRVVNTGVGQWVG